MPNISSALFYTTLQLTVTQAAYFNFTTAAHASKQIYASDCMVSVCAGDNRLSLCAFCKI